MELILTYYQYFTTSIIIDSSSLSILSYIYV